MHIQSFYLHFVHGQLQELTTADMEFLYKLSSSSKMADVRANCVRIVSAIGQSLSTQIQPHAMMKVRSISHQLQYYGYNSFIAMVFYQQGWIPNLSLCEWQNVEIHEYTLSAHWWVLVANGKDRERTVGCGRGCGCHHGCIRWGPS